jgi:DNA-binding protein WhiA
VSGPASFAADVKQELAGIVAARRCCQVSELEGVLLGGAAALRGGVLHCRLTRNTTARKVVRLAHLLAPGLAPELQAHHARGGTHVRPSYHVTITPVRGTPLEPLATPAAAPSKVHCARAFVRGAFLATGAVSASPAGYHLEVVVRSKAVAAALAEAMALLELEARTRRRRGSWVVYLKGSEDISRLLAAMGASRAVMHLENARVLREMRGQANRQVNSETANLRRSVASSLRQAAAVRRLAAGGGLDAQPQAIREVAAVRLAMPEATLQQLADHLGLTKSAVNARMRRLLEIAGAAPAAGGLIDLKGSRAT